MHASKFHQLTPSPALFSRLVSALQVPLGENALVLTHSSIFYMTVGGVEFVELLFMAGLDQGYPIQVVAPELY